jgi:hypothetical protein
MEFMEKHVRNPLFLYLSMAIFMVFPMDFPHFPTIFPGKSPDFLPLAIQVASANFSAQTSSANLVDFLENTLEPGDQNWEHMSGEIWI